MIKFRVVATTTRKNGEIIALIEKTIDSPEKYIIAHEYDARTRSWSRGEYFRDQLDAMQVYINRAQK